MSRRQNVVSTKRRFAATFDLSRRKCKRPLKRIFLRLKKSHNFIDLSSLTPNSGSSGRSSRSRSEEPVEKSGHSVTKTFFSFVTDDNRAPSPTR
jgi:hypothetical protein